MVYEWHWYSWWIFPFLCVGAMIVFMLLMRSGGGCFGMMHSSKEREDMGELIKEVAALRKEIEVLKK